MDGEHNVLKQASDVEAAIEAAEYFINKEYLDYLVDYAPIPIQSFDQNYRYIRLCQIEKIVYDKNEDVLDKLVSVYGGLSQFDNHVVLLIVGEKRALNCTLV